MIRAFLFTCFAVALFAQEEHGYTTADIQSGGQRFLQNCASCHGPDGDAVPDANLSSGRFRRAVTDEDLLRIIRNGIPGTPMPPGNYSEAQARTIVAYLRSMGRAGTAGRVAGIAGDEGRGKTIVLGSGRCLNCHRVNGEGGFLGPDLNDVGSLRRKSDLERALVDPNAEIRVDNHTIRVVERDKKEVRARLLNQDTYRLQGIDNSGKLLTIPKDGLESFEVMKTSPMPSYKSRLSAQELADVVSYLTSLKVGIR